MTAQKSLKIGVLPWIGIYKHRRVGFETERVNVLSVAMVRVRRQYEASKLQNTEVG